MQHPAISVGVLLLATASSPAFGLVGRNSPLAKRREWCSPLGSTVSDEEGAPARKRRRKRDMLKDWWRGSSAEADEGLLAVIERENNIGRAVEIPVLLSDDEVCLLPGDTLTRIEDAPGNARRIFSAIDIFASVDDVWDVLTDYANLHNVVPNLLSNEVVERRDDGCRMTQVGSAELVPGIAFRARCTLDVREYLGGIPPGLIEGGSEGYDDYARVETDSEMADIARGQASKPLQRGIFPRPFAISHLPHRDLAMQSVAKAAGVPRGDFDLYQGVWRMQPLPGCGDVAGGSAMRLSYAVELRPALPVPVRLLEKRIALDLEKNLKAIRIHVTKKVRDEAGASEVDQAQLAEEAVV